MFKFFKILLFGFLGLIYFSSMVLSEEEKIKIGLLVPMTGKNQDLGQQIIKSTRIALKDINSEKLEIYPKDTNSNPSKTIRSAIELKNMGVKIIIGPIFYKSLLYLDEIKDITFLSFTNKTLNLPENIISAGINATSQLNTIKKFIELNKIEKTIFLTPKVNYETEIKESLKESKIS